MEDKVSVSQVGLRYGIIIGLVFIVYGMILEFMGLDIEMQQYFGYVNYVFLVVGLVLAHKAFKICRKARTHLQLMMEAINYHIFSIIRRLLR